MKINTLEIFNVLLVMLLFFMIRRKRDTGTLLVALFVYGTMHFGFAAMELVSHGSYDRLTRLHAEGGGVLAWLSTQLLLLPVFLLLGMRAFAAWQRIQPGERIALLHISSAMVLLLAGFALNLRAGDWMQMKNVIAVEAMFFLLLAGFLVAGGSGSFDVKDVRRWGMGGILVLFIADAVAIYEVLGLHAWSVYLIESTGELIYRASSILFNPNLFGFWASLVYLACAYSLHAVKEMRSMMLWGMALASLALYLSGSRSAAYLLLAVLLLSTLLMKGRLRWVTLLVLPLVSVAIYAVAVWLMAPLSSKEIGWQQIALLGERFAIAPVYVVNYLLRQTGIPAEVLLSIEGRYSGEMQDSGWLVLYRDAGWLGLGAVLWSYCVLMVWGMRAYRARPGPHTAFSLALLCYCLLAGLVMRFQVFPVWLFMGVVLVPCLVTWGRGPTGVRP